MNPTCPLCDAEMRVGSGATPEGTVPLWMCTDRTCTGLLAADQVQGRREDRLGASILDLMRAPVTPHGGSGSNRGRRVQKPGEREAARQARERRYLDQDTAGSRDRDPVERLERNLQARVGPEEAQFIDALISSMGLSQSDLVRLSLAALRERILQVVESCPVCSMPLLEGEETCPNCGR